MPTPTLWNSATQTNTGTAANESQSDTQIIGLSNGNFLVVWVESGTTGVGTDAGSDIVGKILDPFGGVVQDSFEINYFGFFSNNETDFSIAPTNDGGFVIAYTSNGISDPNQSRIVWSRHDANGGQTIVQSIALETVADDFYANPQVTFNMVTGESIVSYTDDVGTDTDINGVIISATGTVGAEFQFAQNSSDFDGNAGTAILTGGNSVNLYREDDFGNVNLEAYIVNGTGGFVANISVTGNAASDPQVAALSDGNWVAVWVEGNNINYRVFGPTGTPVTAVLTAAGTADNENEPSVVGLPQGGFAIVWDNDSNGDMQGQLFTNAGVTDGSAFTVANTTTSPSVGVTSDGRLVFTWLSNDGLGEVFHSVWDPRGTVINATDFDGNGSAFLTNTGPILGDGTAEIITGTSVADNLQGLFGNDVINGGSGQDVIDGGDGNDTLSGESGVDTVNGGNGDDVIRFTSGHFFDNVDGGLGRDTLDASASDTAITVNLQTQTLGGFGSATQAANLEVVIGTAFDDTLTNSNGSSGNSLSGGDGNDLIFAGSGGAETLDGGNGTDTLDTTTWNGDYVVNLTTGLTNFAGEVYTNFENLIAGGGYDTLTGTSGNNIIQAGAGNDTIFGGAGVDQMFGQDGDDILVADAIGELLDGGLGTDMADYSGIFGGTAYWTLADGYRGTGSFAGPITITFVSIEDFSGTDGGVDNVLGTGGNNRIWGNGGDDWLRGVGGNDTLEGGAGNDIIDGGTNSDQMSGGLGDDVFYVDHIADSVFENAAEGTDEVRTSVNNYTLGANLENLRLQGGAVVGTGNALANTIIAGVGPATLNGLAGDDTIFGSGAGDTIDGGANNDSLYGRNGNDNIQGGAGDDLIRGEIGSDTLTGGLGNDQIFGDEGIDTLFGGDGDDDLRGGLQNDTLYGNVGADTLRGEDGNDNLYGGSGRDFFTGGAGNDNFYFENGDFSGTTAATADRITDFVQGADRIRLNLVDANANVAGDQAFSFIGTGAFTGVAGQLRYVSGATTMIYGDVNGDGTADFAIALTGAHALVAGDFVL